jgi:gliding motility-associated-like protein
MRKTSIQKLSKNYALALWAFLPLFVFSQTNVTTNTSAIAMAQAIVGTTSGVTVSSASFIACGGISPTGTVIAAGTFTNTSGDLGIANGIVLTTGSALDVGRAATYTASVNLGYNYSDPNLVAISAKATYDVCALTFTFVPVCSALNITFVFGSDEYPKYECDSYNDVFGIFLSGANPAGGNYNAKNIATLPNGTPVSIDSVNNNIPFAKCPKANNPTYYHDNYTVPNNDVIYSGYTVPVTSTTSVTPCSTYVMKIAIADAGTGLFDSGVFIQGSSVDCAAPATVVASATKDSCGKNNGTAKATITNFSGTPTYSWSPGGQTTASISGLTPGTYTCVVGLPSCSTVNTQTVTAMVTAYGAAFTPTVTTTSSTVCAASSVTLTASGATGGTYTWTPGSATTNTLTITGANTSSTTTTNTLSVIATNTLGCKGTTGYTLTVQPTPTITLTSPTYTACSGTGTSFSVSSSASSYSWTAPADGNITSGNTTATPTTIGTNTTTAATSLIYTVTGTLGSCTSKTGTVTLTVNPLPAITIPNDSICSGGATGTLVASSTAANTYTWNTGVTGSTFTVANVNSNATYTVTGTNTATTCSSIATGNIIVRNPVKLNASQASICPGATATLTVNGANTYTWSTGSTSASTTVSPLVSTNYTVNGTDIHGCSGSTTASVTVSNSSNIVISSTKSIICSGITDTLNATGASPGTYTWTASDGTPISGNSAQIAITQTTSSVTYTVSGSSGGACIVNPGVITVTIQPVYTVSVASSPSNAAVCPGGTLTLNGSPASTYTYNWSGGISNGTPFTPASSQIYTVTATDVNGCHATATQSVTVYPTPNISINGSPSLTICTGATATLTASGTPSTLTSYTWNTGSFTDTIMVTPPANANYSLTAMDGNGCIGTQTTTVNVVTNLAIHVTVTRPIACPGVSDTLIAHGASTYSWLPAGSVIPFGTGDSATVLLTGTVSPTYSVIGYLGTCKSQTDTFRVQVDPAFNVNIVASPTNAAVCNGNSITLSGNGAGTYTYTFSGGINNGVPFTPSYSATPQPYTLTGTDANGCIATNTVAVTVNALPTVTITPISACAMETATLTANSLSTITSYTWNNTTPGSATQLAPQGNSPQSYTVTATDNNGCISQPSSTTVGIYAPVTININTSSGASVCSGASNTLTASGTGIQSYTWANTSPPVASSTVIVNPIVKTSYTVLGTDQNGCIDTANVTISISPLPGMQTASGNDILCLKATNTFSVSPVSGVNYYWTGPAPSTATVSTNSSASITKAGIYTLNSSNSCGATPSTFTLTTDSVKAIFTPNTPVTGQVPVSVTFTNNSQGTSLSNNWNFGNGNNSTAINPTQNYTTPGVYLVILTVSDGHCEDTMSVKITVNELPAIIIIPNIFTPNGDNINDMFTITATGITNFDCKVYDRWGIFLHEWTGVDGGWDGKGKSGANCPDGTYFYLINYTDNTGKIIDKDGYLQLIR